MTSLAPKGPFRPYGPRWILLFSLFSEEPHRVTSNDLVGALFQIPPGALIPRRIENLLPACKNLGTTHITNGCFRLHPVE